MTSTRKKHEHWLIGSSTSVLKEEFINRDLCDKSVDLASSLPFCGPLQLPTKMQALKLFWFFKDEIGRTNTWSLTNGDIALRARWLYLVMSYKLAFFILNFFLNFW